jgi:Caspase domain
MKTAAVVIGINAYKDKDKALTSAINDAKAFREALLKHNLVTNKDIQMFTSPSEQGWPEASKKNINDAMYDVYTNKDDVDQFFFFFSGHGMLTHVKGEMRTVLLPVDVENLSRDGGDIIDFVEMRGYLRHGGPKQQFYFIDACRDLNPDAHPPSVGTLSWGLRDPPLPSLAQATLYAVSEYGKARGKIKGMAVMTGDLIKALDGTGLATDYDSGLSRWVVSMKSIGDYVKDMVEQKLTEQPAYLRAYMRPQLDDPDPPTQPLRYLPKVNDQPLTINIKPDYAADDTNVDLSVQSLRLAGFSLPPKKNGDILLLPPQQYLVEASYRPDSTVVPVPCRKTVDLRKEHKVEIIIPLPGSPEPPAPPEGPGDGPRSPNVLIQGRAAVPTFSIKGEMTVMDYVAVAAGAPLGRIVASSFEPQVAIEIEALQSPYQKWSSYSTFDQQVATGSYRVRFRLGVDVFNETTLYVKAGETVKVSTTVDAPPLVREALDLPANLPNHALISESIGNIQAGVLQTMLPLLGVKAFDTGEDILHQFTGLIEPLKPEEFGMHPLSVVIAIDGTNWGDVNPVEILRSIRCQTEVRTPLHGAQTDVGFSFAPIRELELKTLSRSTLQDNNEVRPDNAGFKRVGLAVITAPAPSFELRITSPYLGEYHLACAAMRERATVVTVTFRPDGSIDISQNILRLPGRADLYANELVPDVTYARMVRELQLGQQLFRSGELIHPDRPYASQVIEDLLYAKWTDPILSCMAFLAWQRRLESAAGGPQYVDSDLLRTTATNLHKYFFNLPDSHVIYGVAFPDQRSHEFDYLLELERVPVLADNVRILAQHAIDTGREEAKVVRFASHMSVRQIWASTVRSDEVVGSAGSASASAASLAMTATTDSAAEDNTEESSAAGA